MYLVGGRINPRRVAFLAGLLLFAALVFGSGGRAAASEIVDEDARAAVGLKTPRAADAVSWSSFAPAGWVASIPFSSAITATSASGLTPLSDAYALSSNGGVTWSAWSTANLTVNTVNLNTHQLSVSNLTLPDSASLNYIRFRVSEMGIGEAVSPNYRIQVDTAPPAAPQNLAANPGTWTNADGFTVSWTNPPDAAPVVGAWRKVGSAPTAPDDGVYVAATNSMSGILPAADGAHPIYVWLQDALGRANHQNAAMTTLYWDTTAPDPPTRMTGSPARVWTNVNDFSESWKNPTDLSGIVGAYYKLNAAPVSSMDGTFVKTESSISGIAVPRDGRHDIYVWLVDAAGNVDHAALTGDPDIFWYDGTLPVSVATMTPQLPATGWYTASVSIQFSATDLPEDLDFPPVVYAQLNGGPWTPTSQLNLATEGSHRLLYQARDKAGNLETAKELRFGIDKTAPTAALQADRLPNAAGWYTAAVTFTLTVADAVSGSPEGFYRLNDGPWQSGNVFALASDGSYRIEYYGQDAAGNRSALATTEVHVDVTPPVTTHAVDGVAGENGWYVSPVVVHLLPTDGGSGVASTRYRIASGAWQNGLEFALNADAAHEVAYYSTDLAGNAETPVAEQVKLDRVAPGPAAGIQASPAGWSRANAFTVQWSSPADLSGVNAAYVKFSDTTTPTPPTHPRDGQVISQTSRIDNLAVPGEGAYRLYLWLRDTAGNVDHQTASAAGPVLRYDATSPVTTAQIQGLAGVDGWWRSSVTVTITGVDSASGIATIRYRVNGGAWQSSTKPSATFTIGQSDKHLVEHYAEDVAGNVGEIAQTTVRIDMTPPPAPREVRVLPSGWTSVNSFRIRWALQTDQSGLAGAYVRFGSPPANATDGTFYSGATEIDGVQAPGEGRHTVYVWLRDGAGNADHKTAVAISDAVWYDGTSPVTMVSHSAATGLNGWHVEPVTFAMSATDTGSGLREIRLQVDDGPWQVVGASYTLAREGRHIVRISAVDQAGNLEPPHIFEMPVDFTPPQTIITGPGLYQSGARFEVSWTAIEGASGVATYDVHARDGFSGAWQTWLQATRLTSAQFDGQRGHTYFFRVLAQDQAGNRETAEVAAAGGNVRRVIVESIANGGFDTGNFDSWAAGGELFLAVVPTTGPANVSILAARLGDEDYGPSLPPAGRVPVGSAAIRQSVRIPDLDQMREPRLQFWYRVLTYDVMYSQWLGRYVDTLDVTLLDGNGAEVALLLRAGNPTNVYGELYDTGWQFANIDLRPYAGQTLTLSIANHNRNDNLLNTWSYVDQIQIRDPLRLYAPLMAAQGASQGQTGASDPSALPTATTPALSGSPGSQKGEAIR